MKDFTKARCIHSTNASSDKKKVLCTKKAKYILVKNRGKTYIAPLCTIHMAFMKRTVRSALWKKESNRYTSAWCRFIKL